MDNVQVFMCSRGKRQDMVKIQLEIPRAILDRFKILVKIMNNRRTAKELMEDIVIKYARDTQAGGYDG